MKVEQTVTKLAIPLLGLALLLIAGCKKSATQPQDGLWTVQKIWPRGSHPVPSPNGDAVLFTQEEDLAGLYILRDGSAVQVNSGGPAARADYAWSSDGTRFCFSAPGATGSENAGIYLGHLDSPTNLVKLWDRGSHPRFLPGTEGIICDGPDTSGSALFQLPLSPGTPQPLRLNGISPEVSPDGSKISYLQIGSDMAQTLVVINRETGIRSILASKVVNHCWLSDSQSLVFECLPSGTPVIATVQVSSGSPPNLVAAGADPSAFSEGAGFVFSGVSGDRLDGLFTASITRDPVRISHAGAMAVPAGSNRIFAQDSTGILEFTR